MPTHHFKEDGHNYGAYQSDIYKMGLQGIRPSVSTDPRNWESEAKKALSANAFGYVVSPVITFGAQVAWTWQMPVPSFYGFRN